MMAKDHIDPETGEVRKSISRAAASAGSPNDQKHSFVTLITTIGNGDFIADVDHEMKAIIAEIKTIAENENRDAKGMLTLKIKFEHLRGGIAPTCSVEAKLPCARPVQGLVFGDEDGNLYAQAPTQPRFAFSQDPAYRPDKT